MLWNVRVAGATRNSTDRSLQCGSRLALTRARAETCQRPTSECLVQTFSIGPDRCLDGSLQNCGHGFSKSWRLDLLETRIAQSTGIQTRTRGRNASRHKIDGQKLRFLKETLWYSVNIEITTAVYPYSHALKFWCLQGCKTKKRLNGIQFTGESGQLPDCPCRLIRPTRYCGDASVSPIVWPVVLTFLLAPTLRRISATPSFQ